jgi:hypothetical protein
MFLGIAAARPIRLARARRYSARVRNVPDGRVAAPRHLPVEDAVMSKPTAEDESGERHTLAIFRNLPRSPRGGRPPKESRQRLWYQENIAHESIDVLEGIMRSGLGPGCVLERDGVVVAEGPKLDEKQARVDVGGYFPSTQAAPAELVECITKGTATPEVLATLTTASPSEAVRFSLDVLWETYQRTVQATEELINQGQRHLERAMKQQEWFINLLQKNSELELELRAVTAEETVKENERKRARNERAEASSDGRRFTKQDVFDAFREFMDYARAKN